MDNTRENSVLWWTSRGSCRLPCGWVPPSELPESPALVVSEEQGFRRASASLASDRSWGKTELVGDCPACSSLAIRPNRD